MGRHGRLRNRKRENAKIYQKPKGNRCFWPLEALLGGPLGALLGRLGGLMGSLGAILGRLGAILARLEAILSHLHALLGSQEAQKAEIIDFP